MNSWILRPALLIAEPEPQQALSVRKLVMETAKFNVLTAHSTHEALETLRRFAGISAVVIVSDGSIDCNEVADASKKQNKDVPVVFLSPNIGGRCAGADYQLSSHDPQELLNLTRTLLGDPRQMQG